MHPFFLIVVISSVYVYLCSQEKGITEIYFTIECYTIVAFSWQLVLYLYSVILQITALVLAFKIRKVEINVLNDSKEISAIVYITAVINVELIVVSILLADSSNIELLLFHSGVLLLTTLIVGLIYIPKVFLHT